MSTSLCGADEGISSIDTSAGSSFVLGVGFRSV
jgi:hypothetical protein